MNKTLILVRGVSGSGKSTLANLFDNSVMISADDHFIVDGEYKFNPDKLKENHKRCFDNTEAWLKSNSRMNTNIVVHNTFTSEWELRPYLALGDKYKARVITLVVENRHGGVDIHDVPEKTLHRQEKNLQKSIKLR